MCKGTMPRLTPAQPWTQGVLWLLGAVWAARSLQSFLDPNFTSPNSAADWFAVISFSVAFALLPVGIWILLHRSHLKPVSVRVLSVAAVVTAGSAAVANVVEDGFGVSEAGTVYLVGATGTLLVLLVTALAVAIRGPRSLALVPLATLFGMLNFERGGGLIVLVAWAWLALVIARPKVHTASEWTPTSPPAAA